MPAKIIDFILPAREAEIGSKYSCVYRLNDPINNVDPSGTVCTYSQGNGQLLCFYGPVGPQGPYLTGKGFSGNGAGLNNPQMQNVASVGPLPAGSYFFGPSTSHISDNTRQLIPYPTTNFPAGRNPATFYLHGGTFSEGCAIINDKKLRGDIPTGENLFVGP